MDIGDKICIKWIEWNAITYPVRVQAAAQQRPPSLGRECIGIYSGQQGERVGGGKMAIKTIVLIIRKMKRSLVVVVVGMQWKAAPSSDSAGIIIILLAHKKHPRTTLPTNIESGIGNNIHRDFSPSSVWMVMKRYPCDAMF